MHHTHIHCAMMMRCYTLLLLPLYTSSPTCSSVLPLCNHHDNSNLLQFKNSFAIDTSLNGVWACSSYSKTASWKNGTDCCEWDGVTCDTTSGHVIGLDLSCSMLEGEFHPNSTLFHVTHLQQLNLAFNNFSNSPIYPGIGNLVSLTHLNLSYSSFGSHIPSTISHLSKLLSLHLSSSYYPELRLDESTWSRVIGNTTNLEELVLDGVDMSSIRETSLSLLMNFSSSLLILSLDETRLHGKFPTRILGLINLEELSLYGNEELKVELPKSNWSTPLWILDLSLIPFSEEIITDSISHLKSLNKLRLQDCQFDGLIPVSLWNLTQLTELDLSGNRLHGEIPSLFSNLKHLTYLDLSYNTFRGNIPDVFNNFTKLDTLRLSSNRLGGQLPSSLFDLTQLSVLDLSDNKLGGQLPSSLLDLTQLSDLSLSSNQLIGPIPSKNATLPKLETLDLRNNHINGTIPDWCYSLSSSKELYLSMNQLTGPISKFSTYSLIMLDLSMNQLTGPISKFSTYSLEYLFLSHNKFQGDFPNSIFEFLKNLTDLDMSSNDLSGLVDFSYFSKLESLNYLDLSNNILLSVDSNSSVEYTLPKLKHLDLSFCSVTVFPSFLPRLQNLINLDLSKSMERFPIGLVIISCTHGRSWTFLTSVSTSCKEIFQFHQMASITFQFQTTTSQEAFLQQYAMQAPSMC
ncbi:hypothetical protein S245_022888 [Arachis hypogaea]